LDDLADVPALRTHDAGKQHSRQNAIHLRSLTTVRGSTAELGDLRLPRARLT